MQYSWSAINKLACKQLNKFCVYVSNGEDVESYAYTTAANELLKHFHDNHELKMSLVCDGLFSFDSKEDAEKFYGVFTIEGVDSSGIYAALYSPSDGCLTENT